MKNDYLLCNWHIRSDFDIPELLPWPGSAFAPVDINIVQGIVPNQLDHVLVSGKYLMVGVDETVWLHIEGIARFLVQSGSLITVQLLNNDALQSWRLFLLGSVLGYLCHQRKLFPLHAATLRVNGHTVAIAGHSGCGKSTLALALTQQGHALLSDDVTVLQISSETGISILPAFPRLKLWRDTLDALNVNIENLPRVREDLEKFDLRSLAGFDPISSSLDAVIVLGEKAETELQRLAPIAGLPVLSSYIFRPQIAKMLSRNTDLFTQAAQISRSIPIYRLNRPKCFKDLHKSIELLEELFCPDVK